MQTALTIAGSDSGGGAGIQADLKTFAAHRVYGTCAVTAVTAQNTTGVQGWRAVDTALVVAQIESVLADIGANAVKIGMLATAEIVHAVARTLDARGVVNIVLDPVMIAKGGEPLLQPDAVEALRIDLLPMAHVVTPNIPEAEAIANCRIRSLEDAHEAARQIKELGPTVVVVKGGHGDGPESIDVVHAGLSSFEMRGQRFDTRNTHGTGCTLSSAIAANLANGLSDEDAVREARRYVEGAIRNAPDIGAGHGPLNHMWRLY
jgi:hydroxymethylpyrimidine/phosphomethylpyrimidine kinase